MTEIDRGDRGHGTRQGSRRSGLIVLAVLLVGLMSARPGFGEEEFSVEAGFTSLFNGKDLSGWRIGEESLEGKVESADHRFKAEEGAIVIQGAKKIEDLYTVREFSRDFVLRLEFRAAPRANSGLYLRKKQLQVRDYPTIGPYTTLKNFKAGDWNQIEVTVKANPGGKGAVAECTCNGEVLEQALAIPAKGPIGVQSETGKFEYRRIRIKEQP